MKKGHASVPALVSLLGSAVATIITQTAASATGSSLAVMLGAATAVVGIYGFLLLAYRDLLQNQAALKGEPDARREAIAQLREDLDRLFSEVNRKIEGLETRERERLSER